MMKKKIMTTSNYVDLWEKIENLRKEVEQLLPEPRTDSESKQISQIITSLYMLQYTDEGRIKR